jgi:hypothetical protein
VFVIDTSGSTADRRVSGEHGPGSHLPGVGLGSDSILGAEVAAVESMLGTSMRARRASDS